MEQKRAKYILTAIERMQTNSLDPLSMKTFLNVAKALFVYFQTKILNREIKTFVVPGLI